MRILFTLFLFLNLISTKGQNYITDYFQPSIIAHEHVLKSEYFQAIELLENCVKLDIVRSPELYTLGISYVITGNSNLGKEYIYKSYREGHTDRSIKQDSILLKEYLIDTDFTKFYDSCMTLITLHNYNIKTKYEEEGKEIEKIFVYRWKLRTYLDSIKETVDSASYSLVKDKVMEDYNDEVKVKLDAIIENFGWKVLCDILAPQNFSFLIFILDDDYIQSLVLDCFEELKKGNVTPGFYATLFDLLEKRYTGDTKYGRIRHVNNGLSDSAFELLKSECFKIGIGRKEVLYLKRRSYTY